MVKHRNHHERRGIKSSPKDEDIACPVVESVDEETEDEIELISGGFERLNEALLISEDDFKKMEEVLDYPPEPTEELIEAFEDNEDVVEEFTQEEVDEIEEETSIEEVQEEPEIQGEEDGMDTSRDD